MTEREIIEYHLIEALRALEAEENGELELAGYLRAQTKSRLMNMSDKELWELANVTAALPDKSVSDAFNELKATREELRSKTLGWEQTLGFSRLSRINHN
jgi:hypothetical protein